MIQKDNYYYTLMFASNIHKKIQKKYSDLKLYILKKIRRRIYLNLILYIFQTCYTTS